MRRRSIDSQIERQLLMALIVSKPFLAQAVPVLDLELVESEHFRLVAKWCLDYFQEYKEAPGKHIESIYYSWAETRDKHDETVNAIQDFLEHLSDQYDNTRELNLPFLIDSLRDFLSIKKLHKVSDALEFALSKGDRKEAETVVTNYMSVNVGQGSGVDVLNDRSAWARAFSEPAEPLLTFEGPAGKFFNPAMTRDALVGIQGPEKRGKTWWCVEMVMRALRQRRKVALFEVGDLSESQIMLRLGVRLAVQPLHDFQTGEIKIPRNLHWEEYEDGDNILKRVEADTKTRIVPTKVSKRACVRACRQFLKTVGIPSGEPYVMVSVHPNSSINVAGIEGILQQWHHEKGFIPDVIVIDYADILAPEDNRKEARHQVNDTWKALRRLSQERHCLVIVPTQANAASYEQNIQSMRNFSEDKRKLAHVTGMIGLNQTEDEKERQIMRLNWIVLRESEFNAKKCLHVGQCLTLGKAYCCGIVD